MMINKQLKTNVILLAIIFGVLCSCKEDSKLDYQITSAETIKPLKILSDSIKIEGDLGSFKVDKRVKTLEPGVKIVTFNFSAETPSELKPTTITFNFPSLSINGFWNPGRAIDKVNYYRSGFSAKASSNAPVLAFYNNALDNRITMALSDALNRSDFECQVKEEDVHFYPKIKLFREKMPKTKSYKVKLLIDTRTIPYYKSIDDVASWWANNPSYKPMQVPDAAKKPMYSTWYSYHQNITADEIVAECKIAKSLGCAAVIVDDGWQTNDSNRGYAHTGDWTPDRIPEMKKFVENVHKEGMKFILWYSLPFMGEKAKNHAKFKGKYLRYWRSQGTYVLDPRYPEVREYIVNTYVKAMQDWNLDGFKLDFMGWFTANGNTKLTTDDGRDFASVNAATDYLMTEITTKLTALKPDVLIEFRQSYIGPLMRKYGNMFRGVDAPNNAVANKIEVTNLRIMAQNTAVHSDMFIWRPEETVEQAALQILNILYSVPQLSVKLNTIPKNHLEMIEHWFKYWNTNKHILIEGDFIPSNPGANYPILTALKNDKQISTVYEDISIEVKQNINVIDIINAKTTHTIAFSLGNKRPAYVTVKDCKGKIIFEGKTNFKKGLNSLELPASGMTNIKFR
ncbi:glycoside hydrolase family 36 protein [Flavivirga abyssicola]|uniref:glycoside hydrolase family 36 protein n=1 Tax=Flavivirga abyssicola TaxID=3063533 RepID=UPI0026DF61D9|nr:glycoside hydrolase family 36 protein [Flavivirga sp. MEBiC07777]WVK13805.1 glycoside hydrolase family 36 protein [Flavivirga sp. MEBiC07777]